MPRKLITFFGKRVSIACDGRCDKAWGINGRQKRRLGDDPDDYVYVADQDLVTAPRPGTWEGGDGRPSNTSLGPDDGEQMNKWCTRECERSVMSDVPGWQQSLKDFLDPIPNMPHRWWAVVWTHADMIDGPVTAGCKLTTVTAGCKFTTRDEAEAFAALPASKRLPELIVSLASELPPSILNYEAWSRIVWLAPDADGNVVATLDCHDPAAWDWSKVYDQPDDDSLDGYYDLLDNAMGILDDMRATRRHAELDAILSACEVPRVPVTVLLIMLSTTLTLDKLPSRRAFVARVRAHLEKTRPEEVEDLLSGLEGTPADVASAQWGTSIIDGLAGRK